MAESLARLRRNDSHIAAARNAAINQPTRVWFPPSLALTPYDQLSSSWQLSKKKSINLLRKRNTNAPFPRFTQPQGPPFATPRPHGIEENKYCINRRRLPESNEWKFSPKMAILALESALMLEMKGILAAHEFLEI